MARDEDMDYPTLGLLALESKGLELAAHNVANTWLSRMMPFYLPCAVRRLPLLRQPLPLKSALPATCQSALSAMSAAPC